MSAARVPVLTVGRHRFTVLADSPACLALGRKSAARVRRTYRVLRDAGVDRRDAREQIADVLLLAVISKTEWVER